MTHEDPRNIGREAASPGEIPPRGWTQILRRVWTRIWRDHLMVVSAGVAFFALWSLFPGIAFVLAVTDYVLDSAAVQAQLVEIATVLPEDAADILINRAKDVAEADDTEAGIGAILTLGIALFVASAATRTLIEGLNIAYEESERRNLVRFNVEALLITLVLILGLILTEAGLLALGGALLGLAAGAGGAALLGRLYPRLDFSAPGWAPPAALLLALGMGLLFGALPARRAARLDPVAALARR